MTGSIAGSPTCSWSPYDIPIGCIGGYYPECNVLMPIWHYAIGSKTPAAKTIPVTLHADDDRVLAPQLEYATG